MVSTILIKFDDNLNLWQFDLVNIIVILIKLIKISPFYHFWDIAYNMGFNQIT